MDVARHNRSPDTHPVTWALILKKASHHAKSRLRQVMAPPQRNELVETLFRTVLHAALASHRLDRVAVISPQACALPAGVIWIQDTSHSMNGCIRQGITEATQQGAQRLAILPSDLPLVRPADIDDLLHAADTADIAIAPDDIKQGTNALALNTLSGFSPLFGVGSFQRHLAQARHLNLSVSCVDNPRLSFDLDDAHDWQKYCDLISTTQLDTTPCPNTAAHTFADVHSSPRQDSQANDRH